MGSITTEAIYGYHSQVPIVQLTLEHETRYIQLTVQEARDLAMAILQIAESAVQDAFIIDFAKLIDLDPIQQAQLLDQFRAMRRDRESDEETGGS